MLDREYFYTIEPINKQVSQSEFQEFINSYPRKLEKDICGISSPPTISYNDFELANRWPYSVVASTSVYSDNPQDYWYVPEENRRYYIMINYQECFNSKTGNYAGEEE